MSASNSPMPPKSTPPDDPHVLAGEYVLGTLPAAARSAVAKRLQTDVVLLARLGVGGHQTLSHTPPLIPAEAGTQV